MKKFLKLFFAFPVCLLFTTALFAQNKTVTGTVTDQNNVPLTGASVTVKGIRGGVTTDVHGAFRITVPSETSVLVISYIGAINQVIPLDGRSTVSVSLDVKQSNLGEVVVIGYGTQRRGDVNGAISSISAKDIADVPQPNIDQMLQGRLSGVTVTQNSGAPGAAVSVHVRGITSFTGAEPLYVIDGVAIDGNAAQQANSNSLAVNISPSPQESAFSVLTSLNPDDIESIDVLKDASATAIYGSRGANGVVIITTKKGKAGQGHLGYDFYWGRQDQGKFLKMMNLPQYATYENNLANFFGEIPRAEFANPARLGPGTNWQNAIFRGAPEYNNAISFSGANNKTDYYLSGGYLKQQGTVIGSNFDRYTFHAGVNSQTKEWLKVGSSITASQNKTNVSLGNQYGIIYNALLEAPDAAVYNADGTFAGPAVINGVVEGGQNPIQQASIITNYLVRTNLQGNVYAEVKFLKDFTVRSELDGNFDWNQTHIFYPTYSYGATGSGVAFANTQNALLFNNDYDNYWSWLEQLGYNHTFAGKHSVNFQVAREVWASAYDGIEAGIKQFISGNTVQTLNLGTQSTTLDNENKGSQAMESVFARLIYTFDNKYSVTANIRQDKSSNFHEGFLTGNFPGVAVSWKLSEEPFMAAASRVLSTLKIRAGYGTTGQANIGQYKYGSAINGVASGLGEAFLFANLPNPNLKWETALQENLGLDFGFLNDRIDGSIEVYKKTSKNFLFQQPLPAFLVGGTAEYSSNSVVQPPWLNAGEIQNTGVEFNVSSRNIVKKDFTWTTNAVFTSYANKIVSLNGFPALTGYVTTGFGPTLLVTYSQPGGPVGEFYGYESQGVIKTQAQFNDLLANPQNVLGLTGGATQPVTSDRTNASGVYYGDLLYAGRDAKGDPNKQYKLGNPNPSFTYSLGNTFTYKGFDLSIFLLGSQGGKIYNAVSLQTQGEYGLYMNQLAKVANYWTPSNANSNIPTPRASFGNNNLVMSNRFLESASYLRIQNLRLGYTLPARIAGKAKLSRLMVYVSGQNLWVITKYSGLDPEVGSLNQSPTLTNIDYGRYPTPRLLTAGLNAEF
jgi:TonB-linked SusC/RagA family outer membrane protein